LWIQQCFHEYPFKKIDQKNLCLIYISNNQERSRGLFRIILSGITAIRQGILGVR
jgi:hypothetical protein